MKKPLIVLIPIAAIAFTNIGGCTRGESTDTAQNTTHPATQSGAAAFPGTQTNHGMTTINPATGAPNPNPPGAYTATQTNYGMTTIDPATGAPNTTFNANGSMTQEPGNPSFPPGGNTTPTSPGNQTPTSPGNQTPTSPGDQTPMPPPGGNTTPTNPGNGTPNSPGNFTPTTPGGSAQPMNSGATA